MWELPKGTLLPVGITGVCSLQLFSGHTDTVTCAKVSPSGKVRVAVGDDAIASCDRLSRQHSEAVADEESITPVLDESR